MRDLPHAGAPRGARQRLHAPEDDLAGPVVALGLHHRGGEAGDPADRGPVLLDQLVRVLQHQEAGAGLGRRLLADVEAGDGGLAGADGQRDQRVAVRRGLGAGGGDRRPLVVARDHRGPPAQRAQKGALPAAAGGWAGLGRGPGRRGAASGRGRRAGRHGLRRRRPHQPGVVGMLGPDGGGDDVAARAARIVAVLLEARCGRRTPSR
nr:hypothetical protein [Elioraea sp.]